MQNILIEITKMKESIGKSEKQKEPENQIYLESDLHLVKNFLRLKSNLHDANNKLPKLDKDASIHLKNYIIPQMNRGIYLKLLRSYLVVTIH
jgi:hypothetical protein